MKKNLKAILITSFTLFTQLAFANTEQMPSFELSCRSQAKDVAVKTYQSCVTENKQKKLAEIRKEYQAKLSDLKKYYDTELKKLSTGSAKSEAQKVQNSEQNKVVHQNGLSRSLPAKSQMTQTLSVQGQNSGVPVIIQQKAVSSSSEDDGSPIEVVEPGQE
jgi:hypothetical protein